MTITYIRVAGRSDIPRDARKRVEVSGQKITLFNIDGAYHAIFDTCPHKSTAPLVRGTLDGLAVRCPNHGYRFDLQTGECNISPQFNTRVYPVKVEGEDILIGFEDLPPAK
jgi:nitrite reductase/ring-hydroxylating ferredoxin subunit